MGLHSHEYTKTRENLRKEDATYLAEYARKIYQERSGEFSARAGGYLQELALDSGNEDEWKRLYIVTPDDGHVRDACFVVDRYSAEGNRELYQFEVGKELKYLVDLGSSYEELPLVDEDLYRMVFREAATSLLSTHVEMPTPSLGEEAAFWNIALETCYEDMSDEMRQALWKQIDIAAPTKSFHDMLKNVESARVTLEMALGVHAVTSSFSARAATRDEVNLLYWRRAILRHVESGG